MPRSRRRAPRRQLVPEPEMITEPAIEEPLDGAEHVSDPHGTIAMLLMLLLMLLLVFLVIAIAQSV